MLQGSSNMRSLFSHFLLYLTWLLGCYCKIIHIRIVITGLCGYDAVHFVNFFSLSEPDNSAKLGLIPASQTNTFLLGGMNEWESPVRSEGEQRLQRPCYPWHGMQCSMAVASSEQR